MDSKAHSGVFLARLHNVLNFLSQLQGDAEKVAGVPVTSFMNRETATELSIAQTQVNHFGTFVNITTIKVNFSQFVAGPTFEGFDAYCPIPELLQNLKSNREFWVDNVTRLSTPIGV